MDFLKYLDFWLRYLQKQLPFYMKQCNAKFGSSICDLKVENLNGNPLVQVYSCQSRNVRASLVQSTEVIKHVIIPEETGEVVFGVNFFTYRFLLTTLLILYIFGNRRGIYKEIKIISSCYKSLFRLRRY